MEENSTQSQRPWFFNLWNDGDSAIVRILHSSTDTIESVKSHKVEIGGKKKRIRCLGDNCPLCDNGNTVDDRIYIHLYDYTDNREKVWERTDKIIPQLVALQNSWSPLNSAVIKIIRKGNEFPKYDIEVQNPNNFQQTANDLVDKQVAKMFSMKRTAEEITEFLNTGKFPERKPYLPKEEYNKLKAEEKEAFKNGSTVITSTNEEAQPEVDESPIFDPFSDPTVIRPRKV